MRIETRSGEALGEATVVVDEAELIDLLQGLADLVEGQRTHLHFSQPGGPQLVVRHGDATDPIERSTDWWVGPLLLFGSLFVIIGVITVLRWALGLIA
jgi:hypothetical protein